MESASAVERADTVGFIGLGTMGSPMARTALAGAGEAGRVVVTARSPERAAPLVAAGAIWAPTPREVADASSVVVLMVPDLPDVEQLLEGPGGLLGGTSPLVLAIGATVSAVAVRRLAERVQAETGGRVEVIDCPVSGGVEGAASATLAIMVGGPDGPVETALPFLRLLGTPVHLGPGGAGSVAKACNQLIVGATVLALGEAVVLAERSGLDVPALLDLLAGGYAASRILETRAPRFAARDYAPASAARYLKKDLGFAVELAEATGTAAIGLPAVAAAFAELVAAGYGDDDIAATRPFVAGRTPD